MEVVNTLSFMNSNKKDEKFMLDMVGKLTPAKKKRIMKKANEFLDMYHDMMKGRL